MIDYNTVIRELSKQVRDYTPTIIASENLPSLRETKTELMYTYSPYLITPICTFILLIIFQPSIVMNTNENTNEESLGYIKLLGWTILISIVLNITYLIYQKTGEKSRYL